MTSINAQKNMKFTSDYPIEKVVFLTSGVDVVPDSTSDFSPGITIPHGLPFTPLPILQWSNTSDFTITNTYADSQYFASFFTTGAGQQYTIRADATNITISRYNFSGSNQSFYYRISCLAPSGTDVESEVEFTSNSADRFVFNSDYNYMKLYASGKLTASSNTYTHNLGYVPRVMQWNKVGSSYAQDTQAQMIDNDVTGSLGATSGVHITSSQIIWLNPNTYDEIEYRIYLDE